MVNGIPEGDSGSDAEFMPYRSWNALVRISPITQHGSELGYCTLPLQEAHFNGCARQELERCVAKIGIESRVQYIHGRWGEIY